MSWLRGVTLLRAQEWAGSLALVAGFGAGAVSGELGIGLVLLFAAAAAAATILQPNTRPVSLIA